MTVVSPPRTQSGYRAPHLVEEKPLRYPDASSRAMMTRRGWWLVLLNFLLPGSAQALAGNRRLGRIGLGATLAMWLVAVLTVLCALLWQSGFITIATNWFALVAAQVLLLAYAVLWIVLTVDTLRLVRLVRTGRAARFGAQLDIQLKAPVGEPCADRVENPPDFDLVESLLGERALF